SAAPGAWRRTERGCRTATSPKDAPATHFSRPRRTTSTSGSSGIPSALPCAVPGGGPDRLPGRLRGLLLGLLLAAPLARAVGLPGDPHRGAEGLLVVRSALLDQVLGHAEHLG